VIGWYIGILGILIGIAGGIYFMKSILSMEGELRTSIFYLVVASFIYVVFSSIMVVLGLVQYDINKIWWEIVPVLFTLSAIVFVYGSYRLVKLLSEIRNKGRENE
jgi:Ca2+/Na+ antiporter